jgi:hypothetical protein
MATKYKTDQQTEYGAIVDAWKAMSWDKFYTETSELCCHTLARTSKLYVSGRIFD